MNSASAQPTRRIAVVSPFLDKRHGTERAVLEALSRLTGDYEIHLYSQRVEDLDLSSIRWHRIPTLPGPYIFNWMWWFAANHLWRWRDRWFGRVVPDSTFSPGVNCFDADVICVHIVFAEFRRQVRPELSLWRNSPWFWPRLLHRRAYYQLIISLEHQVYRRRNTLLAAVSRKVAGELGRYYGREDEIAVLYHGIDAEQFSPQKREKLREGARSALGLHGDDFAVLLIGNDWKKKGLACLIAAASQARVHNLRLMVVGGDDATAFAPAVAQSGMRERISFLPPRPDVEFYYAAADAYVGPSLEDAFALPPAEAMACGLPVIASRNMGVAEIMTNGRDGLILEDPNDSATLASMIERLASESEFRGQLGQAAAVTTRAYTWERNSQQLRALFEQVHMEKGERERLGRREA